MNKIIFGVAIALSIYLVQAIWPSAARAASVDIAVKNDKGGPVEDAVAYLIPSSGKAPEAKGDAVAVMDQKGMQFTPRVLPVRAGTKVKFPNSDNILHHVYSFSKAKTFELPLYKGKAAAPITLDKPGVIVLGCNIHDWMMGYIIVVDTPYFSKTGAGGKAELLNVPPGDYKVFVWHPDMKDEKKIEAGALKVRESGNKTSEFKISLNPRKKNRRTPDSSGGGMGY